MGLSSTITSDLRNADPKIAAAMAANICSTVGTVLINKTLFQLFHFHYATLLTFIHMFSNSIFALITAQCGVFEVKKVDWRRVVPLGCSFVASVVTLNLSLQYNSVGFYQVMKIMIVPVLLFLQTTFWGVKFDNKTKAALVPICIGVGLATTSDVEVNFAGTFVAILGCFSTAIHQIWGSTKQKELGLNALQVLYYQAPISAVLLVVLVPLCDDMTSPEGGLAYFEMTPEVSFYIFLSCLTAFGVNITSYLIVGKASPVTYQVVGHFKTCLVLAGGFVLFASPIVTQNLLGIGVAFTGMIYYTHVKLSANKPAPKSDDSQPLVENRDQKA